MRPRADAPRFDLKIRQGIGARQALQSVCNSLPGLKRTALPGGMVTSCPVRGLRPIPVLRGFTPNTPKYVFKGIAEFATDALRAQLLEWAGYRTRVIEFISTEHTAKNVMITAVQGRPRGDPSVADGIRAFAAFYGFRRQTLASHLGFDLR